MAKNNLNADRKRRREVRGPQDARKPCTAVFNDGTACPNPSDHAHHWFRPGHKARDDVKHMQAVCKSCHDHAHRHKTGDRFPPDWPDDEPYRLDVPDWHEDGFTGTYAVT